jgi:hypothetical protein
MCGIAGIYLKKPGYLNLRQREDAVDWLFCGIEHRGTHASGIAVQDINGVNSLEKSDMPAGKFIFWRKDLTDESRAIILHTRWATKGKPENLLNNHPIEYKNIMAIHNGHISNDDELFKSEEMDRIAEVDSEIIPALLHKYTFDNPKEALEKFSGGFAISAFDSLNPGRLLLAKGPTSPLVYWENDGMWMWASEEKAIKDALFAIGIDSEKSEFINLAYGRYIMIDGETSISEDFTPYIKKYVHVSNNNWSGGQGSRTRTVPRNPYSDNWYGGSDTDQCDECFIWMRSDKLNKFGNQRYCDRCEQKLFIIDAEGMRKPRGDKKLSRKERKRLRKEAARRNQESKNTQTEIIIPSETGSVSEALDSEHWVVCQLVADFYGTNPDVVNEILFSEDEIADFDDPNLVTMYIEFEDKYKEILEEVRGETDALIEGITCPVGLPSDRNFPVGF